MPKITTESKRLRAKWVQLIVFYNQKKKFHFKELPDDLVRLSDFKNHGYETERELNQAIDLALQKFHEEILTTSKVIRIKYMVGKSTSWKQSGDRSWSKNPNYKDVKNIDLRSGICLDYTVYLKKEAQEVMYAEIYNSGEISFFSKRGHLENSDIEVPYSEEVIAFLEVTMKTLGELSHKFIDFFRKPDVLEIMKTNPQMLLNTPNQNTK